MHHLFSQANHFYRVSRRFLLLAYSLYQEKDCQKSAASLTYMTLFAIVPMLTVCYSMFSLIPAFQSVGDQFQALIFSQLLPGNEQVIAKYLSDFSQQARKLTAFGIVFLMVSAYFMLKNIEQNFNSIWNVTRARRGVANFLLYWAILSLGPLLLGLAVFMKTYLIALRTFVGHYDSLSFVDFVFEWLPWLLTASAFTLLFVAVPNCKVRLKHAAIGGVVTLAIFEFVKFVFSFMVTHSNFKLIYGAFAALPLFLLWVNLSWMVILGGAVLVRSIELFQVNLRDRAYPDFFACLLVLWQFHQASDKGNSVKNHELLNMGLSSTQWQRIREALLVNNVIANTQLNEFVLRRDLAKLTLNDVRNFVGEVDRLPSEQKQLENLPWIGNARDYLGTLDCAAGERFNISVEDFFDRR
ncbi:YihY family inner membrane protein [Cellvibrio sp.]|uniref:YihY family inner membrane protein n=1 Tax=Cellvibrio sp. TaxID=1965322 RepID=UPI0039647EA9